MPTDAYMNKLILRKENGRCATPVTEIHASCCDKAKGIVRYFERADSFCGPNSPGWSMALAHDGSMRFVNVDFCPFCGCKLSS